MGKPPEMKRPPEQKAENRLKRLVLKAATPDGKPRSREELATLVREEFKKRTLADGHDAYYRLQHFVDMDASRNITFADAFAVVQEAEEDVTPSPSELPIEPETDDRTR